jgi:hypothetical protein
MSSTGEIVLAFADGERTFRLTVGAWRRVQEKCDAGPMELMHRYVAGTWRVDDLRAPIREGLIGGGMPQTEADILLKNNFDDTTLGQFVPLVQAIVAASIVGSPDDEPGEGEAGEKSPNSLAEKSTSEASTPAPQPSLSQSRKSTK